MQITETIDSIWPKKNSQPAQYLLFFSLVFESKYRKRQIQILGNSIRSVETCSISLLWCSYGEYGELGLWAPSHAERGPSLAQAPRFVQPQQLGRQLLARDLRQRTRHVHILSHPLFFLVFCFCWMLVYGVRVFVDRRRILLIFRVYFGVFSS